MSFFMMVALTLVAASVGAYFFWENEKSLDAEIRNRALHLAKEISSQTINGILAGNKRMISQDLEAYLSHDENLSGSGLFYVMVYDRNGHLLIGSRETAVLFGGSASNRVLPAGPPAEIDDGFLRPEARNADAPYFQLMNSGIHDLTIPVTASGKRFGFVRVGISGKELTKQSFVALKKGAVAMLGILFVGVAFSQIIALGITKPILRISEAAEQIEKQNWDFPLPVRGKNEISRLTQVFNRMAETLKQREARLSNWNRDLFILHTAGLDLMESLELGALVSKITVRAADIIRADTVTLAVVDHSTGILRHLGASGTKARMLKELEMPLESGGIYNWLVSYGTPLLISDAQSDFRLDSGLMDTLGIRCIMTVPLWSSNTLKGVLTAVNKHSGNRFDKHDLRLFTVYSNMAGAALQNASLFTDLKKSLEELKNTQEQLVHSSKMAAIGELAANVAHEINNPLTSVLGYTGYLLKTLSLPDEPKRVLGMMEQETLRVRKIIRNLLDFSRQKPSWMQPSDILIPIKESLALVQGMAEAASVRIHEDYPASPVIVNIDHNEMKQVFINIIYNALQAMPRGGGLWVRLTNASQEVVAEVEDTGIGIPPENLERIFEPFFSTKESGDGTGLGLSISYRIVQNHGGRIEVVSTPGKGTIFRVILPGEHRTVLMQQSEGVIGS